MCWAQLTWMSSWILVMASWASGKVLSSPRALRYRPSAVTSFSCSSSLTHSHVVGLNVELSNLHNAVRLVPRLQLSSPSIVNNGTAHRNRYWLRCRNVSMRGSALTALRAPPESDIDTFWRSCEWGNSPTPAQSRRWPSQGCPCWHTCGMMFTFSSSVIKCQTNRVTKDCGEEAWHV